jgi:8-oxo-dGTP diphosphatase
MARSPEARFRLVVAAVIRGDDGRLLLARRPPGGHLEGVWEFPGGGVHDGEAAEAALRRELTEELGVTIQVGAPATFAWHRDAAREILLLFYEARIVAGEPTGLEGQEVRWFAPADLAGLETPPADADLIRRLSRTEESRP